MQLDQEEVAVPARPRSNRQTIVERFLDEDDRGPNNEPRSRPALTAILFADIADSTALTERLGDADFRAKARDLDAALRTVIREHAGTPIEGKLLGDGVLAVFTSARQAIEAALAAPAPATRPVSPSTSASTPATSSARDEQRLRRRRQHRLAHQRAFRAGGGAGVGDGALAGAHVGGRARSRTAASRR